MEEFLEIYKTSTIELVYIYQFELGGLGDFIKFAQTIINFCWNNKIKFYVVIDHPLVRYITFKYPFMNFVQRGSAALMGLKSYKQIILNNDTNITENDKMIIFPSGCHQEVFPSIMPANMRFLDIIDFNSEVYSKVSMLQFTYTVVHLRCGDKLMECAKGYAGPTQDIRKFDEKKLHKLLEELHSKGEEIYFYSDNRKYKKQLAAKYPFIHINDIKIGHIGLQYVNLDDILNTLVEFVSIMRAHTIYAITNSGFTEVASQIGERPIVRLWNQL